ncbi:hypothetical protein HK097_003461 [Rhizophlyctis rosea]|uniref:Uncharacterized protein n=1 Tax=Rhizophlyctis rosea TaxID=64517 RepID=A0AAD5S9S4_9FUNG|nr:hypothetical protein HK097_003461 [Rhizophlyctis rosea]
MRLGDSETQMTRSPSLGPVAKAASGVDCARSPTVNGSPIHPLSASSLNSILNSENGPYQRSDSYRSATDHYIEQQRSYERNGHAEPEDHRLDSFMAQRHDGGSASALECLASVATELLSMSRAAEDSEAGEPYLPNGDRMQEDDARDGGDKRKIFSADVEKPASLKRQRKRSSSRTSDPTHSKKRAAKSSSQLPSEHEGINGEDTASERTALKLEPDASVDRPAKKSHKSVKVIKVKWKEEGKIGWILKAAFTVFSIFQHFAGCTPAKSVGIHTLANTCRATTSNGTPIASTLFATNEDNDSNRHKYSTH